jgi:hypothetical protein
VIKRFEMKAGPRADQEDNIIDQPARDEDPPGDEELRDVREKAGDQMLTLGGSTPGAAFSYQIHVVLNLTRSHDGIIVNSRRIVRSKPSAQPGPVRPSAGPDPDRRDALPA